MRLVGLFAVKVPIELPIDGGCNSCDCFRGEPWLRQRKTQTGQSFTPSTKQLEDLFFRNQFHVRPASTL